jgi:hypothetical protein
MQKCVLSPFKISSMAPLVNRVDKWRGQDFLNFWVVEGGLVKITSVRTPPLGSF